MKLPLLYCIASLKPGLRLLNLFWYQAIWFSAVYWGDAALAFCLLLLAAHLALVSDWRSQLVLMVAAATLGAGGDSFLATLGFFSFESHATVGSTPAWLVIIWMAFACTLRHSMAWVSARPRLMVLFAAVGAPLTYYSASVWGAVTFPFGTSITAAAVAAHWICALPCLLILNQSLRRLDADPSDPSLLSHEGTEVAPQEVS